MLNPHINAHWESRELPDEDVRRLLELLFSPAVDASSEAVAA